MLLVPWYEIKECYWKKFLLCKRPIATSICFKLSVEIVALCIRGFFGLSVTLTSGELCAFHFFFFFSLQGTMAISPSAGWCTGTQNNDILIPENSLNKIICTGNNWGKKILSSGRLFGFYFMKLAFFNTNGLNNYVRWRFLYKVRYQNRIPIWKRSP